MKLYINAENQLPVFATSISTEATKEEGVLKVYEQGSSGTISSFIFKRDTTVPLDITVAGTDLSVDDVKNLTFGVKLKGKYDDALVVKAQAASGEKVEEGIHFTLSATFNSSVIDEALKANGDSSDDIESADFIAAVNWENASGEVTESATVDVEIRNNVVREGDMVAGEGTPSGVQWTALAVVKLPYADYVALCEAGEDREDVLYICSDAPSPTAEVESEIESVKESVSKVEENVSGLEDRVSDCETDYEAIEAKVDALAEDIEKLEGGNIDLSGYAKLDEQNTWTARQTFKGGVLVDTENATFIAGLAGATSGYRVTLDGATLTIGSSVTATYHGNELATLADIKDVDLADYAKLSGADFTGAVTIDGVEVATKDDLKDVDLDGYAKLDEENTWTARQTFNGGVTVYTDESFIVGIAGASSAEHVTFSGVTLTIGNSITATYHGNELATLADIKDVDLSDYAKLSGADFTGTVTVKGVEVATKDDLKDVDLDGYAKLDEENTWTAVQNFSKGISVDTESSKFSIGIAGASSLEHVILSGTTLTIGNSITATYHGNELATLADIKDVDLSDYAKLSGADFTGAVTIDGVEVATKDDLKDVDLSGYATEEWVKSYHDTDIEAVKAWVTEELSKLDAATQAAEIEELQEEIEALKDEIYAAMITVEIPEDDYEFRLSDLMEGSSASNDYTGGKVPVYDFSVDWGDYSGDAFTNDNWEDAVHTYEKAGEYLIKIKGTFEYIGRKGYSDSDEKLATSNLLTELWLPN